MRCAVYVACMREKCIPSFDRKTKGKRLGGKLDVDGRIILKFIVNK
jgi:hypothetical protein